MLKLLSLLALASAAVSRLAAGQSIRDRLKNKAEESVGKKVEKAVDCAICDTSCIEKAMAEGKTVKVVPTRETLPRKRAADSASAAGADALEPAEGVRANFDFKPGERVLYADDFLKDEVGDFPRSLEFVSGSMEIVEWQGARYLRASSDSKFDVVLKQPLAERYTLEFDLAVPAGALWLFPIGDEQKDGSSSRTAAGSPVSNRAGKTPGPIGSRRFAERCTAPASWPTADTSSCPSSTNGWRHPQRLCGPRDEDPLLRRWRTQRSGVVRRLPPGSRRKEALRRAGREGAGGLTEGIYFDTGSDRMRPESTPTLREIAAMLNDHADLKLTIEGRTDNVGIAAPNQALSEKRAAAVVQFITEQGIDATRLSSKGFGATTPADSNDTPEGRQNNRRVEFVKM